MNTLTTPNILKTVHTSFGPVEYEDVGQGPVLFFVHGVFVNRQLWRKVVTLLSKHYRCIVPTLPFGAHETPAAPGADVSCPGLARLIFEMIAALKLQGVTLIANDTGGALVQLAMAEEPEHPAIARLVFTNCDALDVFPPARFVYLRYIGYIPFMPTLLAWQMRLDFVRRLPIALGSLTKYRLAGEILDMYLGPFLSNRGVRRDVVKLMADMKPKHTRAAAQKLSAVRKPVLLAWAPEDRLFPLRLAEGLHTIFPDSRIQTVADSGCFIAEDQPEKFARLVREFVPVNG